MDSGVVRAGGPGGGIGNDEGSSKQPRGSRDDEFGRIGRLRREGGGIRRGSCRCAEQRANCGREARVDRGKKVTQS